MTISIRECDSRHAAIDHQLDRMEKKLDTIIERSARNEARVGGIAAVIAAVVATITAGLAALWKN